MLYHSAHMINLQTSANKASVKCSAEQARYIIPQTSKPVLFLVQTNPRGVDEDGQKARQLSNS